MVGREGQRILEGRPPDHRRQDVDREVLVDELVDPAFDDRITEQVHAFEDDVQRVRGAGRCAGDLCPVVVDGRRRLGRWDVECAASRGRRCREPRRRQRRLPEPVGRPDDGESRSAAESVQQPRRRPNGDPVAGELLGHGGPSVSATDRICREGGGMDDRQNSHPRTYRANQPVVGACHVVCHPRLHPCPHCMPGQRDGCGRLASSRMVISGGTPTRTGGPHAPAPRVVYSTVSPT